MSAVVAYVPSFAAEETRGVCRACRVSWCWWLVAARLTADGLPVVDVITSLVARLTADGGRSASPRRHHLAGCAAEGGRSACSRLHHLVGCVVVVSADSAAFYLPHCRRLVPYLGDLVCSLSGDVNTVGLKVSIVHAAVAKNERWGVVDELNSPLVAHR